MLQTEGFNLSRVSTQRKTVTHNRRCEILIPGLSPKSKCRDPLVSIIGQQDPRNSMNRILVLIGLTWINKMEGRWMIGHPIRASEVDGNRQIELEASS